MELNRDKIDVDPDYECYNTALRKAEEKEKEENKLTSEKLLKIISEEFDKDLSNRQKQLEEIEDKIFKAQKLLHLVRYVLVTSYYNKKSLEHNNEEDTGITFDLQSRIHPAVKKLLGSNASLPILNSKSKRRIRSKNKDESEPSTSHAPATKKIKLEPKEFIETGLKSQLDSNQNALKNRKKTRHRIVVGNISKWMPSLENDNTTHKWMVYVRGVKEAPDVSHIIEKVIFYLHPSYKPHDVVEISESPFHLSRRGWGEFPLRVQIFFKSTLNKPVSIVHNLKLDKTYTGRQTLGNETIVDLYLHDNDLSLTNQLIKKECENIKKELLDSDVKDFELPLDIKYFKPQNSTETVKKYESTDIKSACNSYIKEELLDSACTNLEHNYCHEEEVVEETIVDLEVPVLSNVTVLDHSYSLPYDEYKETLHNEGVKNNVVTLEEYQNNSLAFGLGETYADNNIRQHIKEEKVMPPKNKCVVKTLTTVSGQPIRFLPQSFNKVLLSNGNVVQIKLVSPPQSVLKKVTNTISQQISNPPKRVIDYEKYKVTLPRDRFKNLGEALPYLFKKLPLWNALASDIDFKCTYPFVATSEMEFRGWNIGKKRSSEWSRAKAVKKIVSAEQFPNSDKWSTKTFLLYARTHGYSPTVSCKLTLVGQSIELELLATCFTNSLPQKKFSLKDRVEVEVEVDIDGESDDVPVYSGKSQMIHISDGNLKQHFAFVKEAALDCGIVLKPEEISEGVIMNAAERMILEAVKCLAEGLIRRARHHLMCQEDSSDSEITADEIKIALNERSELQSIVDFQKKKREMEFFS